MGKLKKMIPSTIRIRINKLRNHLRRSIFNCLERFGWHLLPVGHYSPIPNTFLLKKNKNHWHKEISLDNINYNSVMENRLNADFRSLNNEFKKLPNAKEIQALGYGEGFGEIEALILYGIIRRYPPKRMIEVGAGVSTYFAYLALDKNAKEGKRTGFISIEPYPWEGFKALKEKIDFYQSKLQDIDLAFFKKLGEGDILFIDSSHTVKIGSDVNYLILEVLPQLNKGVIVHFHDIPLPYSFPCPPDFWIFQKHIFWQEPVMLLAFLMNNDSFEIIYSSSYLHFKSPNVLEETFELYDKAKHFPASLWLRKIK